MRISSNCFSDHEKELRAFIDSFDELGDCEVSRSENVNVIDLNELKDFFQELVDNFELSEDGQPLKKKIQSEWSFFSSLGIATSILNIILRDLNTSIINADSKVVFSQDIVENYEYWEVLKKRLKWETRFLTDIYYLTEGELGWDRFFNEQIEISPQIELFRARLHHKSGKGGFSFGEMGAPPKDIVGQGRANSEGIPVLYLSDKIETVLYEARSAYLDELSIGKFRLVEGIERLTIVDFTYETPLFAPGRVNEKIKAKMLKEHISADLSKPMRRYDTTLEYIPTQFICEFIRVYTGADGIQFRSSLDPTGNNFVLFDPSKMECTHVDVMKVNHVQLRSNIR